MHPPVRQARITVRSGAHDGPIDDVKDCGNDRCELRGPKQKLGTDVWNGFSIRVPADFLVVPLGRIVAQMKMPYDAGADGSPSFALRIDDGQWTVTAEHLYEFDWKQGCFLTPSCQGHCQSGQGVPAHDHSNFNKHDGVTDYQVRAYVGSQAPGLPGHILQVATKCTTRVVVERQADLPMLELGGGWTDFIVRMRSFGVRGIDGLLELYIDGALAIRATGEFGYPDVTVPPTQYFKLDPYRTSDAGWGGGVAALDYHNIRRGRSLEKVLLRRPASNAAARIVSGASS